jgi:hypothetical protein
LGKESTAGICEEVDYVVKSFCTAKVGIGNFLVRVLGGKITHQFYFVSILLVRVERKNILVVFAIHCENQIEGGEVSFGKLSGTADHGDIAFDCGGLHPSIGWIATMIVGSTSRITFDLFAETGLGGEVIHDIFGSRRAADVSEADEEEFHFRGRE